MSSALPLAVEYHRWFYELAQPYLGERILDVGSGVGNHLPFFDGRSLICLDLSATCVQRLQARFGGRGQEFLVGDICDTTLAETLRCKRIDTVTCFNVLEHIEDERQALSNMCRILEPMQGHLVLIVPAHEMLYGSMDYLAGHYRRFSKGQLCVLLRACGFEVVVARYLNAVGAIGWFINGRILKPKSLSARSVNTQLLLFSRLVVPLLKRLESKVHPPFGQSLLAVARVP